MKKLIIAILSAVILLCSASVVSAETAASDAVISQDSDFVPLYTTAPDSSLKDHSGSMSTDEGILFYTQTTLLALIAGYLIVFKIRCIPKGEKMHGRRKRI